MDYPFERHVWAEIDLDALRRNFRVTQRQAGGMPLCAVVKADAYGHGAVRCAQAFAQAGAAWLAVSKLTEALELRRGGLGLPILILGRTDPQFAPILAEQGVTQCCYSLPYALALSKQAQAAGVTVDIHLKADTGMGRIGFALCTDFDAAVVPDPYYGLNEGFNLVLDYCTDACEGLLENLEKKARNLQREKAELG